MYSNVTIKNVSWPHFSWATLYVCSPSACDSAPSEMADILSHFSIFLWLQHPDKNPVNYEIFAKKCSRGSNLIKFHKVDGPTSWHGWHCFDRSIIDNATDDWHKCLRECVHVKGRLFEWLIWLHILTHAHVSVLILWEIFSSSYCRISRNLKIIIFVPVLDGPAPLRLLFDFAYKSSNMPIYFGKVYNKYN